VSAVPSGRPRLVHLTTTDMSLALLLAPQLRAFADAGYEVVGVSEPGPYVGDLTAAGIEHRPLRHATRRFAPAQDARAGLELAKLLRALRPTIVHTHNPKPGVYGRIIARTVRGTAVVNTCHGLYALPSDPWSRRAAVYGLERLAATCSHAELVQNREDLETLARLGVPRRKLTLLGNGIDLARFDPATVDPQAVEVTRHEVGAGPAEVLCGTVGRLVWEKGYREVFAAAEALRGRAPHVRMVTVGPLDPDKGDAVTALDLDSARVLGGVRHLGFRAGMERLYAAMDLFVIASHREGFPRAAMEATAMGVPVIATDVRGCREVVDDGVTGVLVPVGDADALARAVERLAGDEDLRRRMGRAGRTKARRDFDQQRVIDITLGTYERLLPLARTSRMAA